MIATLLITLTFVVNCNAQTGTASSSDADFHEFTDYLSFLQSYAVTRKNYGSPSQESSVFDFPLIEAGLDRYINWSAPFLPSQGEPCATEFTYEIVTFPNAMGSLVTGPSSNSSNFCYRIQGKKCTQPTATSPATLQRGVSWKCY